MVQAIGRPCSEATSAHRRSLYVAFCLSLTAMPEISPSVIVARSNFSSFSCVQSSSETALIFSLRAARASSGCEASEKRCASSKVALRMRRGSSQM